MIKGSGMAWFESSSITYVSHNTYIIIEYVYKWNVTGTVYSVKINCDTVVMVWYVLMDLDGEL